MIGDLYPHALDCGISPERFWELSIPDIIDTMESFRRQEERKAKHELMNLHFLARDIGQFTTVAIQGGRQGKVMEYGLSELLRNTKKQKEDKGKAAGGVQSPV